ncbi:hypothetical protein MTO96_008553 [Rhipicephalus appendiculatus]
MWRCLPHDKLSVRTLAGTSSDGTQDSRSESQQPKKPRTSSRGPKCVVRRVHCMCSGHRRGAELNYTTRRQVSVMKPNVLCVVAAFFAIALGQTLPKFQEKDVLHSFFCRRTGGRVVLEDTSFSFRHFLMKYEFLLYNGILNLPKKGELSGRCNTFAPNRKKDVFISCTFDLAGSVAHYDVEKKNSWRWRNDFFRIIATVKTGYLRFSVHFSKEMKKPEDVSLAVFVDPVALDISHPEGISLLAKVEKKFTAHATASNLQCDSGIFA